MLLFQGHQIGWPNELSVHLQFWQDLGFKPMTEKLILVASLTGALLEWGKDGLAQCQDNVTEWVIKS